MLHDVPVEASVVLGSTSVPIRELLKIGRGAVITLDGGADDPSILHINGLPLATGTLVVDGGRIAFEVRHMLGGER